MDVMSLDTNIPQNKGIKIICKAYENFYKDNLVPTHYVPEMKEKPCLNQQFGNAT